ncbi:hypothetical protein TESS_TESS_00657 [Tessaracoccus sp. O5.2]|uniref:hypothetical protein n=1 Tax=Tessaracoccus sp. O5.2 TaxID=3157622 RepID=UPI0035EE9491
MNTEESRQPQPDVRPRACLVSGADEIRFRSYLNHAIYARTHGIDYRLECGIDRGITNKFFYKTSIIRRVLPLYEWLIWIDDDAYFTDFSRDNLNIFIEQAERDGNFMVLANGPTEPNGFWSVINTGVVLFRNDPRTLQLLELMEGSDLAEVRAWWDEDAHGVFTHGDQDQMLWALETSGLMAGVAIVDHRELNSRGHYYDDSLTDAFVMHFCGHYDKKLGVARFAERFGLGQELVPEHLLDEFSVRVRSPMTPVEFWARSVRMGVVGRIKRRLRPLWHWWKAKREQYRQTEA